jgi:hypothetical protein
MVPAFKKLIDDKNSSRKDYEAEEIVPVEFFDETLGLEPWVRNMLNDKVRGMENQCRQ